MKNMNNNPGEVFTDGMSQFLSTTKYWVHVIFNPKMIKRLSKPSAVLNIQFMYIGTKNANLGETNGCCDWSFIKHMKTECEAERRIQLTCTLSGVFLKFYRLRGTIWIILIMETISKLLTAISFTQKLHKQK